MATFKRVFNILLCRLFIKTTKLRQLKASFIALGLHVFSFEIKQLVSVIFVLLTACRYLGWQSVLQRGGESFEAVKDSNYAVLFGEWWNGDFHFCYLFL